MQKHVNLVDLVKSFLTSNYLQKSACFSCTRIPGSLLFSFSTRGTARPCLLACLLRYSRDRALQSLPKQARGAHPRSSIWLCRPKLRFISVPLHAALPPVDHVLQVEELRGQAAFELDESEASAQLRDRVPDHLCLVRKIRKNCTF